MTTQTPYQNVRLLTKEQLMHVALITCSTSACAAPFEHENRGYADAYTAAAQAGWMLDVGGLLRCPRCVAEGRPAPMLYVPAARLGDWPLSVLPAGDYETADRLPGSRTAAIMAAFAAAEPVPGESPEPPAPAPPAYAEPVVDPAGPLMPAVLVTTPAVASPPAETPEDAAQAARALAEHLGPDEPGFGQDAPEQPAPDATVVMPKTEAHTETIAAVAEDGGAA